MSETQKDGIGWVMPDAINHDCEGYMVRKGGEWVTPRVEVAFGPELARLRECERELAASLDLASKLYTTIENTQEELAALRRDRERLERWLAQNRRSNEIINEVFGEDKYAMPTTPEEFDAYMHRLDAAMEEEK